MIGQMAWDRLHRTVNSDGRVTCTSQKWTAEL